MKFFDEIIRNSNEYSMKEKYEKWKKNMRKKNSSMKINSREIRKLLI